MKNFFKTLFTVVLMTPVMGYAQSGTDLSLPSLFADHMVLQQECKAPVWGWAQADTEVKLVGSWNLNDTIIVKADDCGRWKAEIQTAKYGGPYTLQIIGYRNKIELKDVMLGEVWLCSGQSNMEWCINNGVDNGREEFNNANYPNIRYFSLDKRGSDFLQDDCKAEWEVCSPNVMWKRSAIAYFFGRKISTELNVPVGLVVSAWGGTPAEVWLPEEYVSRNEDLAKAIPTKPFPWWPVKTGKLYNSMIHPLLPMALAGVVWYQGEANVDNPSTYCHLMQELIASWRKGFNKQLPFYIYQIAPFKYNRKDEGAILIREAQENIARKTNNTYLVCTNDIGNQKNIHPSKKKEAGERMADLVLSKTYGKDMGEVESPMLKDIQIEKKKIILTFTNTEDGLVCRDKEVNGMMIAGDDGQFVPAMVKIRKDNTVEVSAKGLKEPKAVRYCFDEASIGNLFTTSGLPVCPFRTDK